MRFDLWKRWQWALVGIALGLALAAAWSGPPTFEAGGGRESWTDIGSRGLRSDLRRVVRDEPFVSNLTVYPTDKILGGKEANPITFDWRNPSRPNDATKHYFYYAPIPFPGVGDETYAGGIREFLDRVKGKGRYDHVSYRFAWWCQPKMMLPLGALAGLILVGGIWPTVLRLTARAAGMPQEAPAPRQAAGALGGRGPEVAPTGPPRDVEAEDEAMEAVMAKYVNAGTITEGGSVAEEPDEEPDRPVRSLEATALDDSTAGAGPRQPEKKSYDGAYYPVARSSKKDED